MKVRIHKKEKRNQLVCVRDDGSTDIADLGPSLPFHDIAHFVVESRLALKNGFYGNIAQGFSVAQLSDKNVIRTLPQESLIAEIFARALQSLQSGGLTSDDFPALVRAEFSTWNIDFPLPDPEQLSEMIEEYKRLLLEWEALPDNTALELIWIS